MATVFEIFIGTAAGCIVGIYVTLTLLYESGRISPPRGKGGEDRDGRQ